MVPRLQNWMVKVNLQQLVDFLAHHESVLVLSGAGISTASGIGDYRDVDGAWKRPQPVQHQDFMQREDWRRRYWARSMVGYPEFLRAAPNVAHETLAAWERRGKISGVITQNVDRLHQRAGHERVIDLHGRLDQVVCMACGQLTSRGELQTWLERHNPAMVGTAFSAAPDGDADLERNEFADVRVPACAECGGILKPNVVFYGDSVPREIVDQAYDWVDQADALLVLGSSLMVFSSFRFVRHAHAGNVPVAAINRGVMRGEALFAGKFAEDVGTTLRRLDDLLDW